MAEETNFGANITKHHPIPIEIKIFQGTSVTYSYCDHGNP